MQARRDSRPSRVTHPCSERSSPMETRSGVRRRTVVAILACTAVSASGWIVAQERPAVQTKKQDTKRAAVPAGARADDQKAITAASQAFAKAFQAGDQNALAALLTDE